MKNNALYAVSIFTLLLVALTIIGYFTIVFYPFNLVDIKKQTNLNARYAIGDEIDKKLTICKKTANPMYITIELINQDIIPLSTIKTYSGSGCKEYSIAEIIPRTTHTGIHTIKMTACTEIIFKDVCTSFSSDTFEVVPASQSTEL